MRHALLLILAAGAGAQTLIPPGGIARAEQRLTPVANEPKLTCDLSPLPVTLSYSLRYLSGYSEVMRASEFPGAGHSWTTVVKVTPFLQPPIYLRRRVDVPEIPGAGVRSAESAGGFFVGIGHYHVDVAVYDERNRVCRNDWDFDVKGSGEKSERSVMPPNSVAEMALSTLQRSPAHEAIVDRLTLLVNAAPFSVRGIQITARDAVTLTSAVSAALEKLPAGKVRLIVFNLDKRLQFFRSEDFDRRDLDKVADAIHAVQPGTVDINTLQNKTGDLEFIAKLINDERRTDTPSDLAVFIGPRARGDGGLPDGALVPSEVGLPKFYFVDLVRFGGFRGGRGLPPVSDASSATGDARGAGRGAAMPDPVGPFPGPVPSASPFFSDIISRAISKVKGKTFRVATPAEFAKALGRILPRPAPTR